MRVISDIRLKNDETECDKLIRTATGNDQKICRQYCNNDVRYSKWTQVQKLATHRTFPRTFAPSDACRTWRSSQPTSPSPHVLQTNAKPPLRNTTDVEEVLENTGHLQDQIHFLKSTCDSQASCVRLSSSWCLFLLKLAPFSSV